MEDLAPSLPPSSHRLARRRGLAQGTRLSSLSRGPEVAAAGRRRRNAGPGRLAASSRTRNQHARSARPLLATSYRCQQTSARWARPSEGGLVPPLCWLGSSRGRLWVRGRAAQRRAALTMTGGGRQGGVAGRENARPSSSSYRAGWMAAVMKVSKLPAHPVSAADGRTGRSTSCCWAVPVPPRRCRRVRGFVARRRPACRRFRPVRAFGATL
jgi:hypothetical protein